MSEKVLEKLNDLVLRLKSVPEAESKQQLKELILQIKPDTNIEISEQLRKKPLDLDKESSMRTNNGENLRKCSKCGCLTTSLVCLLCGCPTV